MPTPPSGKQRAARVPLDYHRRINLPKRVLILAFTFAPLVWLALSLASRQRGLAESSPGLLHRVHGTLESDCAACHAPHSPSNPHNPGFDPSPGEANCRKCHAAPAHTAAPAPPCAACHREHRGSESPLARATPDDCTNCHAKPPLPPIHSFADHPPFSVQGRTGRLPIAQAVDGVNLNFSHQQHLVAGLKGPRGPVRLECGSCHTLDREGVRLLPVTYTKHCQDCHPLTFDVRCKDPVPHGLQPAQVSAYLRGIYTRQGIPGAGAEEAARAEQFLFSLKAGCAGCHPSGPGALPDQVPPVNAGAVWLPRAHFSHLPHKAVDCGSCHPASTSTTSAQVLLPDIDNCRACHARPTGDRGGARSDCALCHLYHGEASRRRTLGAGDPARDPSPRRPLQDLLPPGR